MADRLLLNVNNDDLKKIQKKSSIRPRQPKSKAKAETKIPKAKLLQQNPKQPELPISN